MQIKIDLKVPSQREHKKLHWQLREAKKFQMIEAVKQVMILQDQHRRYPNLLLQIGGSIKPEHCYIAPILAALRTTGWLEEDCTITLRVDPAFKGLLICL